MDEEERELEEAERLLALNEKLSLCLVSLYPPLTQTISLRPLGSVHAERAAQHLPNGTHSLQSIADSALREGCDDSSAG